MSDENVPYTVSLNIDGPRDPGYLLEVLEAAAEAIRVANNVSRDHASIEYPAEADRALRYVSSLVSRLPQLLEQITGRLEAEQAAGAIRVAGTTWAWQPAGAVMDALAMRRDVAVARANDLRRALEAMTAITTDLGAVETEGDGDG